MIPGTFVLPEGREVGGRLVFREPLRDTLLPLAVVGGLDLLFCTGVALLGSWLQVLCLVGAAGLSFLVAALVASLLRRAEVVLDRPGGRVRVRRPEHGPVDLPLADLRAITVETVRGSGVEAPAAGMETVAGEWVPLHVGWTPSRGGDAARVRALAEEVGAYLGLPVEG